MQSIDIKYKGYKMEEITIKQEFAIKLPKEYKNLSAEEAISKLETMYELYGKNIIVVLRTDYVGTTVTEMDGTPVYIDIK